MKLRKFSKDIIFTVNTDDDVLQIDQFCKKLNVDHLMILPTLKSIDDRKLVLKKLQNFITKGVCHMKKVINYLVLEKQENSDNYYLRLTAEMQDDIGTVGYVQFKNTDKTNFQKDEVFLALEASKAILTLKMPLDASVVK